MSYKTIEKDNTANKKLYWNFY